MSVLRYYVCITLYSDPCGPWLVISDLYLILSLVLCCDIHRSTLISIMYPACMITVHDRKSRALQSSALWSCSKALKDVQFSILAGTDRAAALEFTLLTQTRRARGD